MWKSNNSEAQQGAAPVQTPPREMQKPSLLESGQEIVEEEGLADELKRKADEEESEENNSFSDEVHPKKRVRQISPEPQENILSSPTRDVFLQSTNTIQIPAIQDNESLSSKQSTPQKNHPDSGKSSSKENAPKLLLKCDNLPPRKRGRPKGSKNKRK
ncbi:hypothetical protein FGO68_gene3209 [Halteria grandinella]|uniref:Uncharacterized protein n=1 Tax=Halteria grandinella TaxID=5974 RepID=A0A8J8T795_HALGN|nr:hypothetical protein FGO68_gene3209 [Halteria grandinella]